MDLDSRAPWPKDRPIQFGRIALHGIAALGIFLLCQAAYGQAQPPPHAPGSRKISGGSSHQAFSGKIASLDLKLKVVNVDAAEGGNTEIFPIKHSTEVRSAEGAKVGLQELKPGAEVIIYYDLKGSERAVKSIVVLSKGRAEQKHKKPSPPS